MKRVVTGHDSNGKSIFVSQAPPRRKVTLVAVPGLEFAELWATEGRQSIPVSTQDPALTMESFVPSPEGTRFRVVVFPPESEAPESAPTEEQAAAARAEILAKLPGLGETVEPDFRMHTTDTIDYGIVVSGEIWLDLDDGQETLLRTGDCVIQNGTRHAWRNRSGQPCRMVFVMVGAERSSAGAALGS